MNQEEPVDNLTINNAYDNNRAKEVLEGTLPRVCRYPL